MQNIANMNEIMNANPSVMLVALFGLLGLTVLVVNKLTYGVELELCRTNRLGSYAQMSAWLAHLTGECLNRGYTKEYIHQLKLVSDQTVQPRGVEVVMPVSVYGDYSLIKQVLTGLKGLVSANRTCGLHAHIGIINQLSDFMSLRNLSSSRQMEAKWYEELVGWMVRIAYTYNYFQTVIDTIVAPSRRGGEDYMHGGTRLQHALNQIKDIMGDFHITDVKGWLNKSQEQSEYNGWPYGQISRNNAASRLLNLLQASRYLVINFSALHQHGTVEFRQHHGTSNPKQVIAWVRFCALLVINCREAFNKHRLPDSYPQTIEGMFDFLGLSPSDTMIAHFKRRQAKFNGSLSVSQRCTTCASMSCDADEFCEQADNSTETETFRDWAVNAQIYDEDEAECCDYCGEYDYDCECGSVSIYGMLFLLFAPLALLIKCGIGAYHHAGHLLPKKRGVKASIKRLWRGLTNRGTDSAGMAFIPNQQEPEHQGSWIVKAPVSAAKLMSSVSKYIWSGTQIILLHTRFATHGAVDKANAHPHRSPQNSQITLVHNGVVGNHKEVQKALNFKSTTECDSEAIAGALEAGGIEAVVKHAKGSMSLIWTDNQNKGVLYAWTNGGNPLAFGRLDKVDGPIVFASTLTHLEKAFKQRLITSYEAIIGRLYMVQKDGAIKTRDVKGSEESYPTHNWARYDYRNYKQTPTQLRRGIQVKTNDEYHYWVVAKNEARRPDGTTYKLPKYLDEYNAGDVADVENGFYDNGTDYGDNASIYFDDYDYNYDDDSWWSFN